MSPQTKLSTARPPSYVVWQVSTFVLTTLVVAGVLLVAPENVGWPTYMGIGVLALHSFASTLTHTRLLTPAWRITTHLLALGALVVMGADILPVMPMAALIVILPLLCLVFEFGNRGLVLALVSLAIVLATVYRVDLVPSGSGPVWLQFLPIPLCGIGLLVGAHQLAAALRRREHQLLDRARQLRETLDASEDQVLLLRGLLETIDAVIVAYDDDGVLIWDNPAATRLVERAGIATDGHVVDQLQIYAADQVTALDLDTIPLARAHAGEEFDAELTWFGAPGDQVAFLLSSRQIRRPDSRRYGYVIVGLDVTALVDAIAVREEFLTTVSHELRTPLTSIIGYHELLEDEIDPADAHLRGMLAVAQRNAAVLLHRVSQLLQASGAADDLVVERCPTELDALLGDVLAKHRSAAATLDVRLRPRIQTPLRADVDARSFAEVVDNLVSNALKHTPAGGTVTVGLERRGPMVQLCVQDTGAGLTADEQRRVFDRFYRTASANDLALQGLGVGLSVVKSIVEAHGGTVTVTSRPGEGACFSVVVPAEAPA